MFMLYFVNATARRLFWKKTNIIKEPDDITKYSALFMSIHVETYTTDGIVSVNWSIIVKFESK